MAKAQEGILPSGYWKPIKPDANSSGLTRATKWCNEIIRPSFMNKASSGAGMKRTAYLDGIRGFAALLVYFGHHQNWAHNTEEIFENAFGYHNRYHFACLPGIRIFFSGGHLAVTVFFVLSGYVLSAKPMALMHAGDYHALGDNLSSALFRRWLRLHIPLICITFLWMTSWHVFNYRSDTDPRSSYSEELWNWYCEIKHFTFVFRSGGEPWFTYNYHSWSIPVEFKGSVMVYTTQLAFSRCTRNARLSCEVGLIIYFMYIVDGWYCAAFAAGMLLCDLDLLSVDRDLPKPFEHLKSLQRPIFHLLLCIGIYLGGAPASSTDIHVLRESPGWYYLSFLKPQAMYEFKWLYLFVAATCIVASTRHIPWLKAFFEMGFNQHLGRVSFAFYLVHGPILWSLGDRIYAAVGWSREGHAINNPNWINLLPITKAGPVGLEIGFLLPHLIILPITLWVAEIATIAFDEPSVKFAQWAYARTLAQRSKL